jgi:hypothetical protein
LVGSVRQRSARATRRRELGNEHRSLPNHGIDEHVDVHGLTLASPRRKAECVELHP